MAPHLHLLRTLRAALALASALGCTAAWGAGADLDGLFPHEHNGRVAFALQATPDAEVWLVGDFNGWDDRATPMRHSGDGVFEASVALEPGSYQYKFIVNGRRRLDPSNPEEAAAPDGSINSRLVVLHDNRVSERSHWQRHPARRRGEPTFRPSPTQDFEVNANLSFNRVDGTALWLKPSYRANDDYTPEFDASFAYGWESERVTIDADFAQPVAPNRMLLAGLHFVDGTGYDNQAEVGIGENTMAALLFKHDFADYYDVRGFEPYLRLHLPARSSLRVAYATEDYESLTAQTQWSFFKAGRDRFRPNPQLFLLSDPTGVGGEGRLRATRFEWITDTRRARHVGTVGFYGRGFFEIGAGDFDYARWIADGRAYMRLGRPVHLAMRLRSGARVHGDAIPSQKLFYVGGLGSVRGHEFRAQAGDREVLGNVEYTFLFDRLDHGVVVFYDAGTAWNSDLARMRDATLLQAVGFGFKTTDDDFQLNFAKPIGEVKGGIETTVRLNRTF